MIAITIDAKFPRLRPAHNAFISKTGKGSNLDRAVRDAVHNLMIDDRVKGKRTTDILPATFTIAEYAALEELD